LSVVGSFVIFLDVNDNFESEYLNLYLIKFNCALLLLLLLLLFVIN